MSQSAFTTEAQREVCVERTLLSAAFDVDFDLDFDLQNHIKIKIKSSGQECPLHTNKR